MHVVLKEMSNDRLLLDLLSDQACTNSLPFCKHSFLIGKYLLRTI